MSEKTKNTSGGIGIGMILFLIFMTLKLTGNIDWSWWWITAPIWMPAGLIAVMFMIAGIVFLREVKRRK